MLNNLGLNGKNPLIYHIYTKDRPSLTDEEVAIVGKAIVGESKVSDDQVAFEAGMKQVRSMYFNGKLVYNYRPCEKIELNARELVLTNTVDNSFKLSVKVTPSNCTEEVTFTSSNTDVATVNRDGSIHPVNLGTCDIIVTCDKKSVACKVHVKEQTLYLYNRGVVNNNSEFGQIVHPSDTSKFSYATDNIFLTLAGSTSNYGTIWFSWANKVDFGEYDVMHMDITNAADHSTIIGLTRNNKTGQQGYQNGNPTDVDGTTFVEDRTVIALKQGVNKHSLDVDLVNGDGYLGLYFKRNIDTGDSLEEFININTIYLIRKSVYVLGTGVDTSEEVNVPCTGLSFTQDEIELEYTSNFMYNLNTLLNITPQNCDETVQWTILDDGDNVMSVNGEGYLSITGVGSAHVQAICGKYFDSIRVNTGKSCAGIRLEQSSYALDLSGTSATLVKATVTPSDTTDIITWKSSDTSVVNVTTTGLITAQGIGTATLTATCGNRTATCTVTVIASCTSVSLSKSTYTLDLSGTDSVTFTPTIKPSNTTDSITWSSNKTSVAIVSATSGGTKGTIFAKSPGTADITVKCGSESDSITVTVERSCTGLSLNKTSHTMNLYKYQNSTSADNSVTLTATATPSNTTDTVSWKSSNTNVATVNSNGVVSAKAAGTATITATCGSKTATCAITIIAVQMDVDAATYTGKTGTTVDLSSNLIVNPSSYKSNATWSTTDSSIATINNSGVLTLKKSGMITVKAVVNGIEVSQLAYVEVINQPGLILSAYESQMIPGEQHTFYADITNYNSSYTYNFEVNRSKTSIDIAANVLDGGSRLAVTVTMLTAEAAAVNITLKTEGFSDVTERFEVYVRA